MWEEHWTTAVYEGDGEERRKVRDEHHAKEYDEKESFFKYKIMITGQDTMLPPGQWAFRTFRRPRVLDPVGPQ